ncbi:MarR family winged helix-turn-helix transcriptional regulator [Lichenifustis flavocetrariae]|uniref:MarR family transcriptional regulator n=1 Tax=Lichenifustis flavocetrariae TaxID=2949735 RepID=A0AA42CME0_9HYPH|nr:MarR family transcriptional regulator [Lichenifustis flavocetrariae]MCW6508255.1 MarR family transcriptional regulator [Lichenifustis flavocetrariae]
MAPVVPDALKRRRAMRQRNAAQAPKTIDYQNIDFDIFGTLLSFYVRTVNLLVSRDLDEQTVPLGLSGGTGKISTILLIGANPGIRPSVIAHFIRKDRSAMGKLLDQMERSGLIQQKVSRVERRARELYLTPEGQALVSRTRDLVRRQDDEFFAALDTAERAQLLGLLRKVYETYLDMNPHAEE